MLLRREVEVPVRVWSPVLIVTTLVVCAVGVATYEIPRCLKYASSSKLDVARAHVDRLAHDTFPAWSAQHPHACPSAMDDLGGDTKDPWGGKYQLVCGDPRGILVVSAGEDGIFGTADDVRSSDERP